MLNRLHPLAGALSLLTIALFWCATLWAELWGSTAQIVAVKTAIPWGLLWLIPMLILANLSGLRIAARMRGPVVARKKRRAPVLALNGLLVLLPAALFLSARAAAGVFDTAFYLVQGVELLAGAINMTLMIGNIRDGRRLRRPTPAK